MSKRTSANPRARANAHQEVNPPPRRRVPLWIVGMGIILILAVGVFLFSKFMPLDAPIPADAGVQVAGLDQGFTAEGFPRLGSPDAPIIVEEFASYACLHCRDFHDERFPALISAIAAGRVQFVLIPVSNIGWGAGSAAKGALCAAEQGKFWEMTDVLFDWQKRFVTSTFNERRIRKGAKNMALDEPKFNACMSANRPKAVIDRAQQKLKQRGISGTPTFFINGEKVQDYSELDALVAPADTSGGQTS